MKFSSRKRAFQSYNQTFISFLVWELAVDPVGAEMGDSKICVSLFNQGGTIEISPGKIPETKKA
jgi:hypothetical protein